MGVVLGTEGLQVVDVADGDAADALADQGGLHIKSGYEGETVVVVGDEAADRLAQPAAADQDGGQALAVAEQKALQDGQEIVHRIADALPAVDIADAVEVLPDLGCGGAHLGGQFPGGNAGDP